MNNQQKQTPSQPLLQTDYQAVIPVAFDAIKYSDIEERAKQEGFKRNKDFHIRVIGFEGADAIKKTLAKLNQPGQEILIKKIQDLLQSLNWSFKLSQRYHIKKSGQFSEKISITEDREAYIQLLYLPAMEKFYNKLNSLLGTKLPTQISHVTLFTKGERKNPDYCGIPIPSKDEFESMDPKLI
ncbi:MAG: hypothetical protein PHI73_03230 [Patescibacteria group bacterium]|nr:hypothetical protein [Patescibacteria group bacterium]